MTKTIAYCHFLSIMREFVKTVALIITFIFVFARIGHANDLLSAKQKIAVSQYNQALSILTQIEMPRARYYEGWCHHKLGNCQQAIDNMQVFIDSYTGVGSQQWKDEAASVIELCGGVVQTNVTEDIESDPSIVKIFPVADRKSTDIDEDAINSIKASLQNKNKNTITQALIWTPVPREKIANRPKAKIWTNTDSHIKKQASLHVEHLLWPLTRARYTDADVNEMKASVKEIIGPKLTYNTPKKNTNTATSISGSTPASIAVSSNQKSHYKVLFAISKNADREYLSLMDIGPVYTEPTSNGLYHQYYIGHPGSIEEAQSIGHSMKAKGYRQAQIIKFSNGQEEERIEIKDVTATSEEKETTIGALPKRAWPSYHVLFTILNRGDQIFEDLADLGVIYIDHNNKTNNSLFLIGDTQEKEAISSLLQSVKIRGYRAAKIVQYQNGLYLQTINN